MKRIITTCIALAFSAGLGIYAQTIKMPAPSPLATVKQSFGLSDISVEYSRPSSKGRVIFGDVVPYDQLWRTGANMCTKLTFGEDVKIDGKAVPAGTYSLFSIPGKSEWTIILNKNTKLGGTNGYSEAEDLMRFKVKPASRTEKTETFTINLTNLEPTKATIQLLWENTAVAFDVATEIDEKVMKNIETVMSKDARPYHQAASYYYENKKDMKQALDWATKAFEANPEAYWSALLKAKIQLELKDYKGAIATGEQVKKLAKDDYAYTKMADELIATAKKGGK